MLFSQLPEHVNEKVSAEQLPTVEGVARALTQLVSLHAGEVVEVNLCRTRWNLRRKGPGSASPDWENQQWYCCQGGEAVINVERGKRGPIRQA